MKKREQILEMIREFEAEKNTYSQRYSRICEQFDNDLNTVHFTKWSNLTSVMDLKQTLNQIKLINSQINLLSWVIEEN